MRTFVAIDLPESIRSEIYSLGMKIPGKLSRVSEQNIHITLQFLGELGDKEVSLAKTALQKLSAAPFSATIKGISYFGAHEIRTIYAGVIDNGMIRNIYSVTGALLSSSGLSFAAQHEYIPHATIARSKEPNVQTKEFIMRNLDYLFGKFEVNSICIKKSVLSEEGPRHTTLYERKFA